MKPFEKWKYSELQNLFGIREVQQHPTLEAFLSKNIALTEREKEQIERLRQKLRLKANAWKEDELKSFFIVPLIEIVEFDRHNVYSTFTERNMEAVLTDKNNQNVEMKGRVELVVAAGVQDPENPFFFVHEYKPETGGSNDPLGQLLAAMLTAQQLNPTDMPLFGVYIIGRNWYFVLLSGQEYAVSEAYSATSEAVFQIVSIMKGLKMKIEAYFAK